jgi:hypothetical protein
MEVIDLGKVWEGLKKTEEYENFDTFEAPSFIFPPQGCFAVAFADLKIDFNLQLS